MGGSVEVGRETKRDSDQELLHARRVCNKDSITEITI